MIASALELEEPVRATAQPLIELEELVVDYPLAKGVARAVDHVSLAIRPGEIVGLAGESGCGKSTVAQAILRVLRPPGEITGGRILFEGKDIASLRPAQLRKFRWRNVSLVFQSAMNSLNPVMRVGDQFVDMMQAHQRVRKATALGRAGELLERVGIDRGRVRAYPHELSGGMRQRVVIAMALALNPELLVLDEPTTALDVVVQREILEQIAALKQDFGFAVLFITHDLSLLVEISDRIAIMYAGRIVELATASELFAKPGHPYTAGLIASFPALAGERVRLTGIPGSPPDLRNPPPGCRFHPRCPLMRPRPCSTDEPALRVVGASERRAACHFSEELL